MALFCSVIHSQPVWAEEDEEVGGDYKDPTIVSDDSSSVPGLANLGKKEKKPIVDPAYEKWWFWAAAVAVAGAWVAVAVWPGRQKAPKCVGGDYTLGCIGDGR